MSPSAQKAKSKKRGWRRIVDSGNASNIENASEKRSNEISHVVNAPSMMKREPSKTKNSATHLFGKKSGSPSSKKKWRKTESRHRDRKQSSKQTTTATVKKVSLSEKIARFKEEGNKKSSSVSNTNNHHQQRRHTKFSSHMSKDTQRRKKVESRLLDELSTPPTPLPKRSTPTQNDPMEGSHSSAQEQSNASPYISLPQELVDLIFQYHIFEVSSHYCEDITKDEIVMYRDFGMNFHFGRRVKISEFFSQIMIKTKTRRKNRWVNHLRVQYVDMNRNSFTNNETFIYLRGVHTLDCSGCTKFDDSAFDNLRGVKRLFMSKCNQARLSDEAFVNLRGIEELDISYCNQPTITGKALKNLRGSIRKLNMAHLNRNRISGHDFQNLRGIEYLDMSNVNPRGITPDAMENLRGIHTLVANGMSHCLTGASLKNLRGIHTLIATHISPVSEMKDHDFFHLQGIQTLDIRWCRSENLTEKMLEPLRGVKSVLMAEFPFPLSPRTFVHLRRVQRLDLSACDLINVESSDLELLAGVKHLDMSFVRNAQHLCSSFLNRLVDKGLEEIDVTGIFPTRVAKEVETRLLNQHVKCTV
mmetsp:Transcript_1956/g.7030  ORF Transcript_1956/g.7030 Transcript_1956/m.7030 type:complete len:586 (-) Transcript_1956:280-2037(-)